MRWLFVHRLGPFSFADALEVVFCIAFAVVAGLHGPALFAWFLFGSMASAGITRSFEMKYGIEYGEDEDDEE